MFNTSEKENGGIGVKKGDIYPSFCDFLFQLGRYDTLDSYPAFCWLMNTKWCSLHVAQELGTW